MDFMVVIDGWLGPSTVTGVALLAMPLFTLGIGYGCVDRGSRFRTNLLSAQVLQQRSYLLTKRYSGSGSPFSSPLVASIFPLSTLYSRLTGHGCKQTHECLVYCAEDPYQETGIAQSA